MVAGLSGVVTCLQSNLIGPNLHRLFWNLSVRVLFSSPFVSNWAHIDWLAPGYLMGVGNPTISGETETQVRAACQPGSPTGRFKVKGLISGEDSSWLAEATLLCVPRPLHFWKQCFWLHVSRSSNLGPRGIFDAWFQIEILGKHGFIYPSYFI